MQTKQGWDDRRQTDGDWLYPPKVELSCCLVSCMCCTATDSCQVAYTYMGLGFDKVWVRVFTLLRLTDVLPESGWVIPESKYQQASVPVPRQAQHLQLSSSSRSVVVVIALWPSVTQNVVAHAKTHTHKKRERGRTCASEMAACMLRETWKLPFCLEVRWILSVRSSTDKELVRGRGCCEGSTTPEFLGCRSIWLVRHYFIG